MECMGIRTWWTNETCRKGRGWIGRGCLVARTTSHESHTFLARKVDRAVVSRCSANFGSNLPLFGSWNVHWPSSFAMCAYPTLLNCDAIASLHEEQAVDTRPSPHHHGTSWARHLLPSQPHLSSMWRRGRARPDHRHAGRLLVPPLVVLRFSLDVWVGKGGIGPSLVFLDGTPSCFGARSASPLPIRGWPPSHPSQDSP